MFRKNKKASTQKFADPRVLTPLNKDVIFLKKHHYKIVPLILTLMFLVYAIYSKNIPASTKNIKTVTYTVGPNDTLWKLGIYYSGNNDIREWIYETQQMNKLDNADLQIGQKIKVEDWN